MERLVEWWAGSGVRTRINDSAQGHAATSRVYTRSGAGDGANPNHEFDRNR